MRRWNPENLIYRNTDEYKYLDRLDNVIAKSITVTIGLSQIRDNERFNIKRGAEKDTTDLNEICIKLDELIYIVDNLEEKENEI